LKASQTFELVDWFESLRKVEDLRIKQQINLKPHLANICMN
jgi:hypothetical protein